MKSLKRSSLSVVVLLVMITAGLISTNPVTGEPASELPIVNTSPIIDGKDNSTSVEWINATRENTQFGQDGPNVNIFIEVNGTHLFVLLNYWSSTTIPFTPVNSTVYALNGTANNATHDWWGFQFDDNLDQEAFGTTDSPDDFITIEQFTNTSSADGSIDGFVYTNENGTEFVTDESVGGMNNVVSARSNITITGNVATQNVTIELMKPLYANDTSGHDINLNDVMILRFRALAWFNQTSDFNASVAKPTKWMTYWLNQTGTGFASKSMTNATALIDTRGVKKENYNAISTLIESLGYEEHNLNNRTGPPILEYNEIARFDLYVAFIGDEYDFSVKDVEAIQKYIRDGGGALIFTEPGSKESKQVLEDGFGLSMVESKVYALTSSNTTTQDVLINSTNIIEKSYLLGNSMFTDKSVNTLAMRLGLINIDGLKNTMFAQKYMSYDLLSIPDNVFIDENDNGVFNTGEDDFTNMSLARAFELELGGRAAFIPDTSMFSDENAFNQDNEYFFLRLMPWLAGYRDVLNITSVDVSNMNLVKGDTVTITSTVTINNGTLMNATNGEVILMQASHPITGAQMIAKGNGTYTASLEITRYGFVTLMVVHYLEGYGWAHYTVDLLVEPVAPKLNEVNPVLIGVFIVTVIAFIAVYASVWVLLKKEN